MEILKKVKNLWRFDGDEEPIRVSRRSFLFMGGVVGIGLSMPGFLAGAPDGPLAVVYAKDSIDISAFLAAMTPKDGKIYPIFGSNRKSGLPTEYSLCLEGPEELPALATYFDPHDPEQWKRIVKPMPIGTHTSERKRILIR